MNPIREAMSRDQAEAAVDALMLVDNPHAHDLESRIREAYGMGTHEQSLAYMGMTIKQYREQWARKILAQSS